jgi:hypothetical protein
MSARFLLRRLSPAALLLAALAHAGEPADCPLPPRCPAQVGDKPALVTAVYQVADLVIPTAPAPRNGEAKPANTQEEHLIRLLVHTVAPQSWDAKGGPGCIDYCPLTMSLVVRQSPAVQEQIADLLATLRRAQDVEVALEVRFLSVSESFPERVGLVLDGKEGKADGPAHGVAFLDEKQRLALLEAVQGDARANVMQAPKLTLFNGQCSTLNLTDAKVYVTGVKVAPEDGQAVVRPITEVYTEGLRMTVQPVVSGDRRFVRLNLNASLTSPESPEAVLVPICFSVPATEADGEAKPRTFTQFLQQPRFTTLAVDRTVAIPDGHTAVLRCGIRKRTERVEYGPPAAVSRIPYLNRLFKNVGYERETETVLLLVTPRIVVTEEQEERPVGANCQPQSSPRAPARKAPCIGDGPTRAKCEAPVCDQAQEVAELVAKYRQACAEGRAAEATAFAVKALALDPACFATDAGAPKCTHKKFSPPLRSSGSQKASSTEAGVLAGAGLGGVTGAIVGRPTGTTAAAAVSGAAVGGVAGGLPGNAIDQSEQEIRAAAAAQAQRGPLGLQEVADLMHNGSGDAVIIDQIRLTGSAYNLTAEQIVWLKQNGVSDAVVYEMQTTGHR